MSLKLGVALDKWMVWISHLHTSLTQNNKILEWSKLKVFADDIIKILKIMFLSLIGLKFFWENEKMLVISIFSFSLNVFNRLFTPGHLKSGLCGKELIVMVEHSPKGFNSQSTS